MKTTRLLLPVPLVASVILAALLSCPHASGKGKPEPDGPPATGEIYFEAFDEQTQQYRLAVMNADGTGKTFLRVVPTHGLGGTTVAPSYGIHNGERWHLVFKQTPGQFHPDGQPRGILEAVREDGGARAILVDDPTMYYNIS